MRGRGEARNEPGRWLFLLLLLLLTLRVQAQPPLVVSSPTDVTVLKLKGAFGYVHTATGKLPDPSIEPLETLIARAERGEIRLAVVQEPLKGLPKLRRLRLMGPGIADQSALTSPSTRTLGLVTAADLTGEGRAPEFVPGGGRQAWYFGSQLQGWEASKIPLLLLWASFAGVGLGLAIAALRWRKLRRVALDALAVATAGTVSLLLAMIPPHPLEYVLFVGITVLLAAGSRPEKRSRALPNLLLALVLLAILDTIFRWGLVAHSPLSGYYDSGIRFYGIGNEYMGLLIGAALMSVPKKWLGWVGLGITLLLGLPMLGANAGGAMAASVAFASRGIAARRNHKTLGSESKEAGSKSAASGSESGARRRNSLAARRNGLAARRNGLAVCQNHRATWQNSLASRQIVKAVLLLGVAIATAVFFAFIDRLQPGAAQSHIGQAAGKGAGAWGEIILRKLAMNARLTVAGPTLLALGVAGIGGWQLKKLFARLESELQGRVVQALWGAGAAIAFNDSGTIAALLLLAPVLVVCLEKSLPSQAP